jgi:hypothetical protein
LICVKPSLWPGAKIILVEEAAIGLVPGLAFARCLLSKRRVARVDADATPETTMSELEIILIIMTFVIPAVFILADDRMWTRKKG